MSPQFVDFNADGELDIVAGIFDGSPHVAFGTKKGFEQPVQILDKEGQRIVMNQFWNFEKKEWDSTKRCDPEGMSLPEGHLTSAWATDWDRDGDLDLLLGDHDQSGQVLVRINEGSSQEPAFAVKNTCVLSQGQPLRVLGTVATLRTFDWNQDGAEDLITGGMGKAYGKGTGAAVELWLGSSDSSGTPSFGPALTLVPTSPGTDTSPQRPQTGLHMDVVDFDGDGDLDLIVGGYSHWTPVPPKLNEAQSARAKVLEEAIAVLQDKWLPALRAANQAHEKGEDTKELDANLAAIEEERDTLKEELEALIPSDQRRSFVWLYENLQERG